MAADTVRRSILLVHFSQSGQTRAVADALTAPLRDAGHAIDELELAALEPAPWPWPFWQFLDSFPETVAQSPVTLQPWSCATSYDLVILAYPVWFLSPAPAIASWLRSPQARQLLAKTPVVTVTTCRNMWVEAHRDVLELLRAADATPTDHLALTDPGPALATFITTPRWVLTGRREAFWGLPRAGLTEEQIQGVSRYGLRIRQALEDTQWQAGRSMLEGTDALRVDPALAGSERIGKRSFRIWGRLLRACGAPGTPLRRVVLVAYMAFLLLMIMTVVPVSLLLRRLLARLAPQRVQAAAAELERQPGATAS